MTQDDFDAVDNKTDYSVESSTQSGTRRMYIETFAGDLLEKAKINKMDGVSVDRVFKTLPELLRAFAFKIGHEAATQMHRDIMVFIHRHRMWV